MAEEDCRFLVKLKGGLRVFVPLCVDESVLSYSLSLGSCLKLKKTCTFFVICLNPEDKLLKRQTTDVPKSKGSLLSVKF